MKIIRMILTLAFLPLILSGCVDDGAPIGGPDASALDASAMDGEAQDASGSVSDGSAATGSPIVFLIAGQSNAEGNVFTAGLEGLARALPEGSDALDAAERQAARVAAAAAIGSFCGVPAGCVDAPDSCGEYSDEYADAVIDGLRASTVPWRMMDRNYQHPTATLLVANYDYAPVGLVDSGGMTVDNASCTADAASTERVGPRMTRFTPTEPQPLGPGFGSRFDPEEGPTYGPELAFGEVMARTNAQVHLVKVAMGGSSIQDHWRLDGPLYADLLAHAREALTRTGGRLGGLVWFQGFNDQFEGVYCEDLWPLYEANLRALLTAIRTDLEAPEMPIVIVGPRAEGRLPDIARAQEAVAAGDANITIVPSSGLSHCFHYSSGSMLLIGERAGVAMAALRDE